MSIEAVRQSEPQFRALIEHSTDAIALITRDGTIAYASPSTGRVTGYVARELEGKHGLNLIHPDDLEQVLAALTSICDQPGAFTTMTFRLRLREGTFRWMEGTITNWLADPAIGALVANYRDITERKLQEEALRASGERYRTIVQTTGKGIWLIDAQARTLYANDRMTELLGVNPAEVEGLSVLELVFPEDEAQCRACIDSCLQGHAQQFECRFRRSDGSEPPTSASISPVRDGTGSIVGVLGMFTDITARKRMEHALTRSEELLWIALKNSPVTLYQQDRDLRYSWMHHPLAAFTPQDIVGKTDADFSSPRKPRT
jgi:PAS domain S-box-containing protein